MIDIAYIVSHGFAARMVTQTNLLGQLVERGLKVALIAPDAKDQNLVAYCIQAKITLVEFAPPTGRWTSEYAFARKYLLENIKANPALWEKHIYATKFNRSWRPWKWLRPRLLLLAYRAAQRMPSLRTWYLKKEQATLDNKATSAIIQQLAPSLVVSTYPVNFSEAMLLRAAKKKGHKTAIHLLSWDNISAKGHFPQLADEYISWGPIMRQELKDYYGIESNKIHNTGVPHFDLHVQHRNDPKIHKHLVQLGLDSERPYLFFGMSSPRFAPKEIDIVENLATSVVNNVFGPEMQLIVRPHPQNVQGGMADTSWLPRLKALNNNRVAVDFPDLAKSKMPWSMQQRDMERMSNLLAGAAVSYNSGSTLSIDALMVDTPVIFTSFDGSATLPYWQSARRLIDYVHLRKLIDCGGICIANDYQMLEKHTQRFLNDPNYLMAKRRYTASQECANYGEGKATSKCVNILTRMLNEQAT